MTLEQPPKTLRIYTIIWLGQTASLIGSNMTSFALLIWAWQRTGEATPLALLSFFIQIPIIIASLFAGILVDRYSRKRIMMMGVIIAAICTFVILILFLTNQLAIWHLYLTGVFVGLFGYFQGLAFSTSQSLLVPKQHYIRVGAMGCMQTFGSGVLAPALAGVLYPIVGLRGILIIDLVTFSVAVATLASVQIPQPSVVGDAENPWQQLTFGFRYLIQRPSLMGLQLFAMSFVFF